MKYNLEKLNKVIREHIVEGTCILNCGQVFLSSLISMGVADEYNHSSYPMRSNYMDIETKLIITYYSLFDNPMFSPQIDPETHLPKLSASALVLCGTDEGALLVGGKVTVDKEGDYSFHYHFK